jgi:taurine--2-oxoglutarate transaminase
MAGIETNRDRAARIREDERSYVIHPWAVQSKVDALPVERGAGCYFYDYEGNRYLDFGSQLINLNLGHQHPKVVAAIKEQAERLTYINPVLGSEHRSRLARLVAEVTPGDLTMSFFTNGGAEAVENAIRVARHYTGRHKVLVRYRSYHGGTAGAMAATGDPRRWGSEPASSGFVRLLDPYTYRCPAGHPDPCPVCTGAPHLEEILQYENPETVAAVLLESVTGTNGIIVPPDGYLRSVREVCDRYGILLILDEVMAGFGRTGRWFACDHFGVVPDIMTVAKGINGGYVPLGATVVSRPIGEWLQDRMFPGGLTYSGHPLACAAGVATIEAYRDERVIENAAAQGEYLAERLPELAERHPSIGDVRGLGLFWGLELVTDRGTRRPLVPFNASGEAAAVMGRLAKAGMAQGLHLFTHFNVVAIAPPLIINREELDQGLDILDDVLKIADERYEG